MICRRAPLFIAVISCYPLFTHAAEGVDLDPLVVTATRMSEPLTSVESAKSPRQPVPAQDGADYLKSSYEWHHTAEDATIMLNSYLDELLNWKKKSLSMLYSWEPDSKHFSVNIQNNY